MIWKNHTTITKPKVRSINLKWDFTLQSTTAVRECLRVNMCSNTAKELLVCTELDISRSCLRGNQTATELQYLCKSDKQFIWEFAAITLNRHSNLRVNFSTIPQFIRHFTEKMNSFYSRNNRHNGNVWEMHTQISWASLAVGGRKFRIDHKEIISQAVTGIHLTQGSGLQVISRNFYLLNT